MVDEKKFLDQNGVEYLWSQLSLEDYPNNETLIAVLNAIDTTKADKEELFSGSWNDLKDRPFGEETSEAVALEEQELTFSAVDAAWDDTKVRANVLLTSAPSAGDKVKVKWDGVDYVCEAQVNGNIAFGNFGLVYGEASDEPFAFINEGGWICVCKGANGDIHTVSVSIYSETVKTLDPKLGGMPTLASDGSDAGKFVKVNAAGDGYELVAMTNVAEEGA